MQENKFKIIYITNARIPTEKAHGVQITKMCEFFSLAGAEVELVIPRRFNAIDEDIFSFYDIKKCFKVSKIFCIDLLGSRFFGKFGFFFQYFTFSLSTLIYALLNYKKFSRADMLYFRDEITPHFLRYINKNIIMEIHAYKDAFRREKSFFKKIKGLVLITRKAKEEFIKIGMPENKIVLLPDGVDLKDFDIDLKKESARRNLNLPQEKKLVGYVGMLRTMGMTKGIEIAIDALKKLSSEVYLVIVGGNLDDINYYKKMIDESEILKKRVLFIGRINHKIIPQYLKAFDVLIAPFPDNEHYRYYMSPLKFFEYMASKRPIITTDLTSTREVLDESNSILIKPGSINALAEALNKVLNNKDFAKVIGEKALSDVKNYTWEKRVHSIFNFISK